MKNASFAQLCALKARAARLTGCLPPLSRKPDGTLASEGRAAVEAAARRILQKNGAVGASLVLCPPGGGTDVLCFGSARLRPRQPVTEKTCFRVASVSKLVMAFGALSLCADGLLDLDGDLSALLGYRVRSPHAPDVPVTLRMLLTHTSGLRDEGTYSSRGMQSGCTLRELLEAPENWLPAQPGAAFHYSNLGAGAAGVAMELAAGMPFDELMRARVFSPLGIRASYDPRRIEPAGDLADGYRVRLLLPHRAYDAAALAARPPEPFCPERDYLISAGRLILDSSAMAALIRLLASQDGLGVLPPELLTLMRTCQDGLGGIAQAGRGLNAAFLPGVFEGFSPVGHQGVAYGMCAELFADPARSAGVGVMINGVRLVRKPPLMRAGFDLLALGFAAID